MMNKTIIKSIKNPGSGQRGLTMISWLIVIVFLLFQVVIAMNVLPVYMTDSTVKTIMQELPNDAAAQNSTTKDLKMLVAKRLKINNIYTVKPDHIKVKKGRGELIVTIEYEPRGTLIGSLDYIVTFKHEARIATR